MHNLKRILVCLDLSSHDEVLIKYASMMADLMACDMVYFIHIAKSLKIPKAIQEQYPDLVAPLDETIEKAIGDGISTNYSSTAEVKILVEQGNSVEQVLNWADIKEIDLILFGLKNKENAAGSHASKTINAAHCSVLLIPNISNVKVDKILIPTDYSKSSKMALDQAMSMKAKKKPIEILLQHVYFVPQGYTTTGKTYEEFAAIMEENSKKDYHKFLIEHHLDEKDFPIVYTLDDNSKPSDRIYDVAKEKNMDLIVLGSRGRTASAALLLGSTAVDLIRYDNDIPYLIVKDKHQNMGFFEALMNV